tara:strand:- start:1488 stop:1979 length:492 start_codon:yes stop_codon:yes gene_type:complete
MAIELSDSVLIRILRNHIKENINKDFVIDLINSRLSDIDKGILLEILLSEDPFESLDQDDIVWVKINKYDSSQYGCQQTLRDLNLIQDDYIVGRISDSDNYGSDFDKWHYKFKVEILILREDKWMINEDLTVDRKDIKHITDSKLNDELRKAYKNKRTEVIEG